MAEIKYDIIQRIAVLSQRPRGWERQLNLISWNGGEPKYDIRDWSPDGTRMGKGISLSAEELGVLKGDPGGDGGDHRPRGARSPGGVRWTGGKNFCPSSASM